MRSKPNSEQCLVTTEDFVQIANMDLKFYALLVKRRLPVVMGGGDYHIDPADVRPRQYFLIISQQKICLGP